MRVGHGDYQYKVNDDWARLPAGRLAGWSFGWIPSVAVDSEDRVHVYSRSEHPMIVFDPEGNFLTSWGDEILKDALGIFIDAADNIYCTGRNTHCVHKFNLDGVYVSELVQTLN